MAVFGGIFNNSFACFVIEGPSAASANPDPVLVKEIRRAHRCFQALVSGQARSVAELAKAGIGSWLGFYNEERQHQSLGYRAPRQAYEAECRWRCGRSASPTG